VPAWLVDLFARYGYPVVFFGVCLENAGLPVPGETVLLAGAALAHFGRLSLAWVIVVAACGAVVGDNVGFLIGRLGGRVLAERYGPRVGLTSARFAQFDRFFLRHGPVTVFIARWVTGLRVVGAMLAGGSGLSWRTFLFYNATGAAAWSISIAVAGYSLAYSWATLENWIGRVGVAGLVCFGIVVVLAIRANRRDPASSSGD
jgi:membrane protein DedA with SNARE-associated domain